MFFALQPPPQLRRALGEFAREIARNADGRPVPADNIHLTLAFIGAWPMAQLPVLLAVGAGLRGEPIRITLDTQGGFRRAGVAWIAPSDETDAVTGLAGALADALAAVGIDLDERPFHPHVTLARHCRGPYAHGRVGPFAWDVESLALMQSETREEGARYTQLARWSLSCASA